MMVLIQRYHADFMVLPALWGGLMSSDVLFGGEDRCAAKSKYKYNSCCSVFHLFLQRKWLDFYLDSF